jgi:Spy/CpxP family protein refolding chaperone
MVAASPAKDRDHRASCATPHGTPFMRPHKLTDTQRAEIRAIVQARRLHPTNKQLAEKYGCCKQLIDQISAKDGVNVTPSYVPSESEAAQCLVPPRCP